jgi:hypothetical protein
MYTKVLIIAYGEMIIKKMLFKKSIYCLFFDKFDDGHLEELIKKKIKICIICSEEFKKYFFGKECSILEKKESIDEYILFGGIIPYTKHEINKIMSKKLNRIKLYLIFTEKTCGEIDTLLRRFQIYESEFFFEINFDVIDGSIDDYWGEINKLRNKLMDDIIPDYIIILKNDLMNVSPEKIVIDFKNNGNDLIIFDNIGNAWGTSKIMLFYMCLSNFIGHYKPWKNKRLHVMNMIFFGEYHNIRKKYKKHWMVQMYEHILYFSDIFYLRIIDVSKDLRKCVYIFGSEVPDVFRKEFDIDYKIIITDDWCYLNELLKNEPIMVIFWRSHSGLELEGKYKIIRVYNSSDFRFRSKNQIVHIFKDSLHSYTKNHEDRPNKYIKSTIFDQNMCSTYCEENSIGIICTMDSNNKYIEIVIKILSNKEKYDSKIYLLKGKIPNKRYRYIIADNIESIEYCMANMIALIIFDTNMILPKYMVKNRTYIGLENFYEFEKFQEEGYDPTKIIIGAMTCSYKNSWLNWVDDQIL